MSVIIGKLKIGKVDGKHEYLTPIEEREAGFFDAFLVPDAVEPDRLNNSDTFFIEGFRGTGKTSLLRWHAENMRQGGSLTDFVLFKTDLTEAQRVHISTEVGISWTDIDPGKMEISQDFKSTWVWFMIHKIGSLLRDSPTTIEPGSQQNLDKVVRLLGLGSDGVFKKALGFLPRLEGAAIKIKTDLPFFEAELSGDLKMEGSVGKTTLEALSTRVLSLLSSIKLTRPLFLYFDELEVFYHTSEQHHRDQRMVRDLLFTVERVNEVFRIANSPIHVLAAVRSEVIDTMGSLGQEVDRLVHDRGFLISWHHAKRSLEHPLMKIVRRKIEASERALGQPVSSDPLATYFPEQINHQSIDVFLLDRSFYKPRDIVWRLSIAQKLFPNNKSFSQNVLEETETEYSSKLWDEVRYELSATYSDAEVDAIEAVISGGASAFSLEEMEARFSRTANHMGALKTLLSRRSVREVLSDLYRLGAIGNSFKPGTNTANRMRWAFRGDPTLLVEKRMVIHPALEKRLSTVTSRRSKQPT